MRRRWRRRRRRRRMRSRNQVLVSGRWQIWWCGEEEGGEGEKVHLKTHAPLGGHVGKNRIFQLALKIPTVNKHLPVFLLGTENVVRPSYLRRFLVPNFWRALASKPLNRLSSVTPFYKWEAMSFHHILSDLVSNFGKGPKRGFKKTFFLKLFSEFAKSLQPTLESSSIQTTEPIVKCHTILDMGSHDLSPHTFIYGLRFFKGLQKWF